ncbi:Hypothetical predicted protein [Olea europaea subsp. europaea]|uniref:Ubiquitin-like protease family profile domain-containing protein n=1 Tax=Olea europaea subsp. europaea TaxID=158383 RepID=A0A8S0Q2K0_OLEEU|nr:Hypothetical predicted protein [Olea europaea subsp. europaea]
MVLYQACDDLRMQICKLQSDNKLLNRELVDIKSQMSYFNDVHSTKMNFIVQINYIQFKGRDHETFSKKVKDRGTKVPGVGKKGTQVARGSDKTDEDPQVLMSELSLVNVIIGHSLPLSTPWADVDHMCMPILSTNKVPWMLGVLQFKSHTLTVFNSAGKTYHDWKVLEGIEPYVKILAALMNALGMSKKDPDYHGTDSKELKMHIDSMLPQQRNG